VFVRSLVQRLEKPDSSGADTITRGRRTYLARGGGLAAARTDRRGGGAGSAASVKVSQQTSRELTHLWPPADIGYPSNPRSGRRQRAAGGEGAGVDM